MKRTFSLLMAVGLCSSALAAEQGQTEKNYLAVLDRPATRTEADIAKSFGCKWNANPVYAECNDIRSVGVDLTLSLNPINDTIKSLEITAFLTKPDLTPAQLKASDATVERLVEYFLAPWPARRRWAALAVDEARGRHAATTIKFDEVVLTSEYLWAFAVDGERLWIVMRRKDTTD